MYSDPNLKTSNQGQAHDREKMTTPEHPLLKNMYVKYRRKLGPYYHFLQRHYDTNAMLDMVNKKIFSTVSLHDELPPGFKIGMVVLAHERPDYLELCLDSLFKTNLHDYNLTIVIQDDGSKNPRVEEIINREREKKYRIVRIFCEKGPNCWGAAFNRAIHTLLAMDNFSIVGTCDSDAFFHPEWLHKMLDICIWAKKHDKKHILGPFSCFNSSNFHYHKIIGNYPTPFGNYIVKRGMGALTYFYFTQDLLKLGFFDEDENDEFKMTQKFASLRIRNFCTESSYVEHMGRKSVLDQWRPLPVEWGGIDYGMNLPKEGWPPQIHQIDTLGYYKFIKGNVSSSEGVSSPVSLDIVIPVIEKDLAILPHAIAGVRQWVNHPIKNIYVISPESPKINEICRDLGCTFIDETTVLPLRKSDLHYFVKGVDRSSWLYQQFLKYSMDSVCSEEYFLILDADTVLLRPQVFEIKDKIVFLHSDEHQQPYFNLYKQLFGEETATNLSFVSHQVLMQKSKLNEIKKAIEQRHGGDVWYNTIVQLLKSSPEFAMSEYEIYGQWMLRTYPDEIEREYWFNIPCKPENIARLDTMKNSLAKKYRSVSFHSYLRSDNK